MILCQDWQRNAVNPHLFNVLGLLTNITALDDQPYPLLYPELCVLVFLTEGRSVGKAQIVCVYEETGQRVFGSSVRELQFTPDPLGVLGLAFHLADCRFPRPGMYSFQLWYNGEVLAERPLRLR
jgi:hypothetical protein